MDKRTTEFFNAETTIDEKTRKLWGKVKDEDIDSKKRKVRYCLRKIQKKYPCRSFSIILEVDNGCPVCIVDVCKLYKYPGCMLLYGFAKVKDGRVTSFHKNSSRLFAILKEKSLKG